MGFKQMKSMESRKSRKTRKEIRTELKVNIPTLIPRGPEYGAKPFPGTPINVDPDGAGSSVVIRL
jgi:hypothetical protein